MAATPDGRYQRKLDRRQGRALAIDIANGMTRIAAARKYSVSVQTVRRMLTDDYKPKRVLKPCGTEAAYRRHLKAGERCVKCWTNHAAYEKERKAGLR